MDIETIKKLKKGEFCHCSVLIIAFYLFLFTLIALMGVTVLNKIKEGRYIGQDVEVRNTISISDTGEIYAKPDLALTTFSVISEAKTVAEAMTDNTEKMNAIINFIKNQNVEDKDLKTTSFNIYPRYEWQDEKFCSPPCPSGKRVLVGYEVRQSLQVKIRDLGKIGQIIEGATSAGANQIGDLQFTIDKQDEFKNQAREEAIKKARNKAKKLASQLGVRLVRIVSFSEGSAVPRYYALEAAVKEGMGGRGTPQIEIGENKISVTVTITYEIN